MRAIADPSVRTSNTSSSPIARANTKPPNPARGNLRHRLKAGRIIDVDITGCEIKLGERVFSSRFARD